MSALIEKVATVLHVPAEDVALLPWHPLSSAAGRTHLFQLPPQDDQTYPEVSAFFESVAPGSANLPSFHAGCTNVYVQDTHPKDVLVVLQNADVHVEPMTDETSEEQPGVGEQ